MSAADDAAPVSAAEAKTLFDPLADASALVLAVSGGPDSTALLMLAAPVAIIVNIGRVAVLGLISLGDQNLASGQAHALIGMLLLFPGLMLFMLVVWALNRAVNDQQPAGASP